MTTRIALSNGCISDQQGEFDRRRLGGWQGEVTL
jgi:hypothetical protein